jgi:putative Ca2+/H+ antiporter (TMEM165/GDT1 family)
VLSAFLTSTLLVAIAETGDKTQLLSFVLAAKFRRFWPLVLGILAATIANHALAGSVGAWAAGLVRPDVLRWVVGLAFVGFGLWTLKPDTLDGEPTLHASGAFVTTFIAFFIAEMGDKTQLATITLAARYPSLVAVVVGTTVGMMLANVPAVWLGEALAHRINMKVVRWIAAALFVAFGVVTILLPGDLLQSPEPGSPGAEPGPSSSRPGATQREDPGDR